MALRAFWHSTVNNSAKFVCFSSIDNKAINKLVRAFTAKFFMNPIAAKLMMGSKKVRRCNDGIFIIKQSLVEIKRRTSVWENNRPKNYNKFKFYRNVPLVTCTVYLSIFTTSCQKTAGHITESTPSSDTKGLLTQQRKAEESLNLHGIFPHVYVRSSKV